MNEVAAAATLRLCPLIAFDRIVGGKYKLRILWVLARGTARYGEIRRELTLGCQGKDVTPRTLSRELKDLVDRRLVVRTEYPGVPPKVEYTLTKLGRQLVPVMDSIIDWGRAGWHEVYEND